MKILIILSMIILCGCARKDNMNDNQNDVSKEGTYESVGNGYGGPIEVVTTFKDDKLEDIVVKKHNETPSIGGVALEEMIKKMKEENNYDVDIVAGATLSSNGIKDAVKEAYSQAKNKAEQ